VDPRAGLDDLEKRKFLSLPGLELRPLGRPASSQSLYRLRYPGSIIIIMIIIIIMTVTKTPNFAVEWLGLLLRVPEVATSNLGPKTE
jgi:hypothetical protein